MAKLAVLPVCVCVGRYPAAERYTDIREQTMITQDSVRVGTTSEWADTDASDGSGAPILGTGEIGLDTTLKQFAVGDGSSTFAQLVARHRQTRVTTLTALVAGSKVVSDTLITAASVIIPVLKTLGTITAPKAVACTARTPGTSYTITSADGTDTSIYQVVIIEP